MEGMYKLFFLGLGGITLGGITLLLLTLLFLFVRPKITTWEIR